ncbi:MAG: DNA translocase FtsK, partial [Bacteroidales bacterium]|nr:DNA translocase FtsK [Bacteroidales bacterium]
KPGPKEDKYNTTEFSVEEDEGIEKTEDQPEETEASGEKAEISAEDKAEANQDDGVEFTIEKAKTEDNSEVEEIDHKTTDTEYDPTLDLPHYQYPPLNLLEYYDDGEINVDKKELEENKKRIVETLNHYSIKIEKIRATIGPAVTLYEIIPAPGIRISKIKNLEDDIALSLSALGIRIIAPIPGRGTIGIEVPNKNPEIVSLRSIFSSENFTSNKAELPLGLGKTISNEPFIVDLTKMPHILMAGATGQGKSVGLNAIITSLLYKKHPAQVKFVMVDPKKVELTLFSKIERHFLARLPDSEEAIITDTRQVVRTLNSLNIEMDNRYDLLKDAQVRNIKEYNRKFIARKLNPHEGHRFLPYLILVIDEFADLIMTAGKEIENPLTRLAQLARAIGIHLIIATQRPSVNIITGTIKANFPARVAYRVISKIDSRTILDFSGADQLIGRGDMLLSTGSDLIRLQCAFVDTEEVEKVTDFIGSQRAYPDAYNLPEYEDEESESTGEYDPNERDELFEEAARLIVQTQQGSTSLLQRKLKLGYNRAGRIIDQLEAAGIVGPFEGSKAREVKVANEFALEQHLKDLNS